MKVAYLALHLEEKYASGGIGLKIKRQINNWKKLGVKTKLFVLSPNLIQTDLGSVFRFGGKNTNKFQREIQRSWALTSLIASVSEFQPDLIYLRFATYAFPLHRIHKIAPVVVEINTIDVQEWKLRTKFIYMYNLFTRGFIFNKAAGMVAISNEIAAHKSFRKFDVPMVVISNGIDLPEKTIFRSINNDSPRMIFLGTPSPVWHGVDKLFALAEKMPEVMIDVVGLTAEEFQPKQLPPNIIFHGFLTPKEYIPILERADVGMGTLGLHRKNMNEASPLKVREYLAHGIPTILPYNDTDINGEDYEFILELPNTEDNLQTHWTEVRDFIHRVKGQRFDPIILHSKINSQEKELKRTAFFKQLSFRSKL